MWGGQRSELALQVKSVFVVESWRAGGQHGSGSRAMWRRAEQKMWQRDVTDRGFQPAWILVHVRRADTQSWRCLAGPAFSRKSKLTMFDVGGLCWENCCQTRVEFFCPPLLPCSTYGAGCQPLCPAHSQE